MPRDKSGKFKKKNTALQIFTFILVLITTVIMVYFSQQVYEARQQYAKDSQRTVWVPETPSDPSVPCVQETVTSRDDNRLVLICNLPDVADTSKD